MADIRLIQFDDTVSYDIDNQLVTMCQGPVLLLQVVLNHLLTTPGTDLFRPDRGGGLVNMVRRLRATPRVLEDALSSAVRKVEYDILQDQAVVPFPDNERLVALRFVSATPIDDQHDRYRIELTLSVASGQTFAFSI